MSGRRRENSRSKAVVRSFRIEKPVLDALEEEARSENVSINTLVDRLLSLFAQSDRFVMRHGMVKVATPTLRYILSAASDEKLIEVGRLAGSDIPSSIILARYGTMSPQTVLAQMKAMGDNSNWYNYSDVLDNGKRTITLIHRLNSKGSIFLSHFMEALLNMIHTTPKISTTDHSVTIELST